MRPWPASLGLVLCGLFAVRAGRADPPVSIEAVPDEPAVTKLDRSHWAYRPIRAASPPQVQDGAWCRTPVDRFILHDLEKRGLKPTAEAERWTLLRRLTFDLTGLPPTPAEVAAFEADASPAAYEQLVDRLLASPAYGERWGMFWLDLARFAETDGYEHDLVRPEAWRYRDWVIGALNADLSYDQFIAQQLAADEICPDDRAAQLATGFLLAGPDMPDVNDQAERRHVFLNGMTANVGEVLLGLQYGCAQCHDHKYDPLSQQDFYRLRAFFDPIDVFRGQKLAETSDDPQIVGAGMRVVQVSRSSPAPSRLWVRGDHRRPGPEVPPAVPRVAVAADDAAVISHPESERRRQLAEWLAGDDNPLTARVIVNRLWQHHFGVGLAATPSDFGLMGQPPSHPELLDWLASELRRQAWSLKGLHRLLVTSAVYRTASRPATPDDENWQHLREADPTNRWLGRMTRRRLEGEAIRDALLSVSGRLNPQAGGPGVRPPLPAEVVRTLLKDQWPVTPDVSQHQRRSVYLFVRRNLKFPLFDVFDRPDQNLSCARRSQTTIAPQALALLNSEFTGACAEALAERCFREAGHNPEAWVRHCYVLVLGREPAAGEQQAALRFLSSGEGQEPRDFCLALLNGSEFIYVD